MSELIANALREIAAQAGVPRPMADTAWRAGRRRRLARLSAAAVISAAAIAAAVLLVPLATADGAGHGRPPLAAVSPRGSAPQIHLRNPLEFRQVATESNRSCPHGSGGLPGSSPHSCFFLTRAGMTITALRSARVVQATSANGYIVDISLTAADTGRFATLSRQLYRLAIPHSELAIILDGQVISAPVIEAPITVGELQIAGFVTRHQAENVLTHLRTVTGNSARSK